MKKNILTILLIISLLLSGLTVYATEDSEIIYEVEEITDLDVINDRIEKGITDLEGVKVEADIKEKLETNMLAKEGEKIKVKSVKSTVQKLKVEKNKGALIEEYVAHCLVETNLQEKELSKGLGSGSEETEDGNTGVLYLKVKFKYNRNYNHPFLGEGSLFRFTSVGAKVTRDDSTINFSNLELRNNKQGELFTDIYGNNKYDERTDWNLNTYKIPTTGKMHYVSDKNTYVFLNGSALGGDVAASAKVTVKRGTAEWDLYCLLTYENFY